MTAAAPVPVSGEDQPDPRGIAVARAMVNSSWECTVTGQELRVVVQQVLEAADAADRAAGIRRVTDQFTRQQMWAAWDDGYEAARNGQQKRNPHRPEATA